MKTNPHQPAHPKVVVVARPRCPACRALTIKTNRTETLPDLNVVQRYCSCRVCGWRFRLVLT